MKLVALLAALALALAVAPVADAAPSGPTCDPDSGPFDACNWQCSPNLEQPCAILLTIGGCLWRAVFTQNC